ncbi:MAG: methyltransferase domain-containing protein [Chitinophagaceae bacterium]|nr:methyltransferase domain-containing protein [Chitinophagaceae bacterium]
MMGFYHHHIATALKILSGYPGATPFEFYIKKYFSLHKKHGSKDRKIISDICYSYFRTALAFKKELNEEILLNSFFLTHPAGHPLLLQLSPQLNHSAIESVSEKLNMLHIAPEMLFPFYRLLSPLFQNQDYYCSFLSQPDFFLRIRPGKKTYVLKKLKEEKLPFLSIHENGIALKNATALRDVFVADKEVVVQDLSSQQVLDFLDTMPGANNELKLWDCCAGSGGKSILLFDKLSGNVKIYASDIRESILKNLVQRFAAAGIVASQTFVADLTLPEPSITHGPFDMIVCDVPCTGSGTWARTPEQLVYFTINQLQEYRQKQQKILANAVSFLKENGILFYITCSVFTAENEEVVQWAQSQFKIALIHQQAIPGYLQNADNMFVAVFKKKSP